MPRPNPEDTTTVQWIKHEHRHHWCITDISEEPLQRADTITTLCGDKCVRKGSYIAQGPISMRPDRTCEMCYITAVAMVRNTPMPYRCQMTHRGVGQCREPAIYRSWGATHLCMGEVGTPTYLCSECRRDLFDRTRYEYEESKCEPLLDIHSVLRWMQRTLEREMSSCVYSLCRNADAIPVYQMQELIKFWDAVAGILDIKDYASYNQAKAILDRYYGRSEELVEDEEEDTADP